MELCGAIRSLVCLVCTLLLQHWRLGTRPWMVKELQSNSAELHNYQWDIVCWFLSHLLAVTGLKNRQSNGATDEWTALDCEVPLTTSDLSWPQIFDGLNLSLILVKINCIPRWTGLEVTLERSLQGRLDSLTLGWTRHGRQEQVRLYKVCHGPENPEKISFSYGCSGAEVDQLQRKRQGHFQLIWIIM